MADFISPDDTYAMRTQFSWTATQPVAETNAAGNPTLWYAMIYLHDDRQPDALDSVLIHHQKAPIFLTPGQTTPKLCGKLGPIGDGEGRFEYALLTGAAFNKLRALALAAGADLAVQGLFKVVKIITPPVAGEANADGSVSIDYLKSAGFRYMGYLSGQTVTHPDGTTEVIARPGWGWLNPLNWPGDLGDAVIGGGEWSLGQLGGAGNALWPSATLSVHLRAFSNDPAFQGQALVHGWGANAGQEIGIPGVRVNFWYTSVGSLVLPGSAPVLAPYGGTTDAKGQLTADVPKYSPLAFVEIPLDSDAARITWNGLMTATMKPTVNLPLDITGDTSVEIDDAGYMNALAQFADGRQYLKDIVGYTPHKVKVAEGYAVNKLAEGNDSNAVTTCATFPNLVFSGTTFALWMINGVLPAVLPPDFLTAAGLAAVSFESALNSDMWMPDTKQDVFLSRGIWTHEYGHYTMCSMIADRGVPSALSSLTTMTIQTIFSGNDIQPSDETRILNEAFADFLAAQVAGGTNYYTPQDSILADNISYCVKKPCLEKNMSVSPTSTGSDVIARDITIFMDAFDGYESRLTPNAGDAWMESTSNPGTLTYAHQKYADSCIPGQSTSNPFSTCDEPVVLLGPQVRQWVADWVAHDIFLDHFSFMTSLARIARTQGHTWCDVCRLFAIHTPGNEASPQDLDLTTPIPITQYSGACLSSPIKDWIGPPPDPSLTDLDRVFNPEPSICMVCPVGSTVGPDRCICGPHQIPSGPNDLNCFQCAANEIAVATYTCTDCRLGVPIDGQNACQCNPGATQASDGTCVSACGPHQVWQDGQCVDCGTSASYPSGTTCLQCQPSTPLCVPDSGGDGLCHGDCVDSCTSRGYENPAPGSSLCGPCSEALGCIY